MGQGRCESGALVAGDCKVLRNPHCSRDHRLRQRSGAEAGANSVATASEDANPDATGSPSLIVVRLFVLRGQSAFAAADFFTLWNKEQAVLAHDLVSREEVVLKPGQTTRLVSVTGGDARVLGVVAAYQEIDGATWRAIAPIAEPHATAFMVELARRAVSVQPSTREDRPDRRAKEKNKEEQ